MKVKYTILWVVLSGNLFAQPATAIYKLNEMDQLLTEEVKSIIDNNVQDKQFIFLGESEHHIGSDMLAKAEFVKYLVVRHNIKHIAFEADFFALYFDHDRTNVTRIWSVSEQCNALFDFLIQNNVTIWGFDSQVLTPYTRSNLPPKLFEFLDQSNISYTAAFKDQLMRLLTSSRSLAKSDIKTMTAYVNKLLQQPQVIKNPLWWQIIGNLKTVISDHSSSMAVVRAVRDRQMAGNLSFVAGQLKNEKLIIWAANGHISKLDLPEMKKMTMGYQFMQIHPDNSYHIGFSSIKLPFRSDRFIAASAKKSDNILHLLPTTTDNFFIDTNAFPPGRRDVKYDNMFGISRQKTTLLLHFDALVFISKGELNSHFVH